MFSWIRNRKRSALLVAFIVIPILAGSARRAVWLYNAAPTPRIDTIALMNEIVAAGQPAGENAWDIYYDLLVNKFQASSNGAGAGFARFEQLRIDGPMGEGAWDAIDRTPWLALIDEFSEELGMLAAAADRPRFHKPYRTGLTALDPPDAASPAAFGPFWSILLPEQGMLRRLGAINAGVMRAAAHTGEWRVAADRFRAGLRFGRLLTQQATLIESLVGITVIDLTLYEAARIADELEMPDEAATMFIEEIDAFGYSSAEAAARIIENERRTTLDAVQWVFTDNGAGDGVPLPAHAFAIDNGAPTRAERLWNILGPIMWKRRAETVRLTEQYFDRLGGAVADPAGRIRSDALEQQMLDNTVVGTLSEMLIPALSRISRVMSATESRLAGVRVMMRLEQVRAAAGALPGSLEGALGAEAVDPVTGRVFEFEPLAGDPAGRAYELRLPWSGLIEGRFLAPIAVINEPRPAMSAAPTPPTPAGEIVGNDP